jgi:two-component system, cell cycle sensor histidine kinase and response regulator CckA
VRVEDERLGGPTVFSYAFAPLSETSLAAMFQDVTAQRATEDQLRHAQKMEAVGRLAGGVAHDFNNLLTVIIGYLHTTLESGDLPPSLRADIAEAAGAAQRAGKVTSQLLAFSRQQVLQPRIVSIDALIGNLSSMLTMIARDDIHLRIQLRADNWMVRADPVQLEQVVLNLVVNACDAMPNGGTLTIHTERLADTAGAEHGWVRLTVADTGVGMDDVTRARVFEPFFTTKGDAGTGLGLASVYGIVKQSGGHVTCESRPDEGARFHVDLPIVAGAPESTTPPVVKGEGGGEAVLIVEDNDALRRLMALTLDRFGYRTDTAANGEEALALVRGGKQFDLLVTDIVMPGMSGRNVADAVARLSPRTRTIFVSAHVDDVAANHPLVNFLQKPFLPNALAQKVRDVLDA